MIEEKKTIVKACQETFKENYINHINVSNNDSYFKHTVTLEMKNSDAKIICRFTDRAAYLNRGLSYDYECLIGFENINVNMVSILLEENHYNYEIIVKSINEFYKLGEKYRLFKTLKPLKDLKIEDGLSLRRMWTDCHNTIFTSNKNISNIQFSNFYKTENHKKSMGRKKLKGKNMTISYNFILRDGAIHPIATIDYPVAPNVSIPLIFDIHPTKKEEAEEKFMAYYNELDVRLNKRINQILKKELQLTDKTISQLTIEDKLNYLMIAEMSEI